ncbi:uncharacterized protein LOC124368568 [Homalodisca vitripennis]|uniref:uncharacterized protein LOC124368568 n=1 Tax=Homalodisca vitripennis TaxID=197043 RepID=UPI001EEBEE40|nr:uncharacterized protein LOC124368568 [Homalodisca vitripennis]
MQKIPWCNIPHGSVFWKGWRYSSLSHFKSVVALVALVLSNIDEEKRCKKPIPDIDEANDEETGESNGNDVTGNENTEGNCPTEQISDTAAFSVFLGDSDQVPSAKLDNKASLSVSLEDDSNQFGGFHYYNLNSGMSELVPAYDTLDEIQAQSLRAPEVELQNKEDDDIIDNSRYVLPYSHGPARRRHNRVNVIRAIEEPELQFKDLIIIFFLIILQVVIFIYIISKVFTQPLYPEYKSVYA